MVGRPLPKNARVSTRVKQEGDGRWSIRRISISVPPGRRIVMGADPFGHGPYATPKELKEDVVGVLWSNTRYTWPRDFD